MLGCCELLAKDASDAEWMIDNIVRRAEENIRLYNDNNKYARLVRAAYESKFGKPKVKDIMKEKKTKKMTKAEAFEWLKCKKIDACGYLSEVQEKLFSLGITWFSGDTFVVRHGIYLFINEDGELTHGGCDEVFWKRHCYEEIKAEDILSIEIEEECAKDDEDPYFRGRIKDLQEMIKDEEVLIITKTNFLTMTK